MLPVFACEQHRHAPFDPHDGVVTELNGARDTVIQVGEGRLGPRHMVGGLGVEDPLFVVAVLLTKLDEHLFTYLEGVV